MTSLSSKLLTNVEVIHNATMPADGQISLRSIIRSHNKEAMPKGVLHYWFIENDDVWAVSMINAVVVSGAYCFTRFMYTGNIFGVISVVTPIVFAGTLGVSVLHTKAARMEKRRKGETVKGSKDMVRIHSRVPMFPGQPDTYRDMPPSHTVEFGGREIDLKKLFEHISLNDVKNDPRKVFDYVPDDAVVNKKGYVDPKTDPARLHNPFLKKSGSNTGTAMRQPTRPEEVPGVVKVGSRWVVKGRGQEGPPCPCGDEKQK